VRAGDILVAGENFSRQYTVCRYMLHDVIGSEGASSAPTVWNGRKKRASGMAGIGTALLHCNKKRWELVDINENTSANIIAGPSSTWVDGAVVPTTRALLKLCAAPHEQSGRRAEQGR